MQARLIPLGMGDPIDVVKDMTLIGRSEDCDVRVPHKSVSKLHCILVKTDGLLLLRDLGSTNGTRVNGKRVRRAALLPNDTLSVAGVSYHVRYGVTTDDELENHSQPVVLDSMAKKEFVQVNSLPDDYPDSKLNSPDPKPDGADSE